MKFILSCLFVLSSLGFLPSGNCQCTLANIHVSQSQTGNKVQGKPEWNVSITNDCICTQEDLRLDCNGFQTVEALNSSIVTVDGTQCNVVNGGNPIYGFSGISFKYAWNTSVALKPNSSTVSCS